MCFHLSLYALRKSISSPQSLSPFHVHLTSLLCCQIRTLDSSCLSHGGASSHPSKALGYHLLVTEQYCWLVGMLIIHHSSPHFFPFNKKIIIIKNSKRKGSSLMNLTHTSHLLNTLPFLLYVSTPILLFFLEYFKNISSIFYHFLCKTTVYNIQWVKPLKNNHCTIMTLNKVSNISLLLSNTPSVFSFPQVS